MMSKPKLTIGMIFRNDIRCIERCLKALAPLRKAIPCELIMADTGSDDGSRQIAEQYADLVFDFPWVDDFSAARNAVMERASGKWYFTVDTDEYLDENIDDLKRLLRTGDMWDVAAVIQRNYTTYDMDDLYDDFVAYRLARMSTGARYQGIIHESLKTPQNGKRPRNIFLRNIILHHDGYVELNKGKGAAKRQRNVALLREALEHDPENLRTLLELIESGYEEPDIWEIYQKAAELVEAEKPRWQLFGPSILRYTVTFANEHARPDADEWVDRALQLFPDSYFTRIDVQYTRCIRCMNQQDYAGAIEAGEAYLAAIQEHREGKAYAALTVSGFQYALIPFEQAVKVSLAVACVQEKQYARVLELLESVDCTKYFEPLHATRAIAALMNVYGKSALDTTPTLLKIWREIAESPEGKGSPQRASFHNAAFSAFMRKSMESEREAEGFHRYTYTMFLPLEGECELGRAAALMEMTDAGRINETLSQVEDWAEFPAPALAHALGHGAAFPPEGRPMMLEEMDSLAMRLAADPEGTIALACRARAAEPDGQALAWARGLLLAAVQVFPWEAEDADIEQGMTLARLFAAVEKEFLPCCYAEQALTEARLFLLPPMHRFGWYCVRAFDALDAGNTAGFVRLLREGLASSAEGKGMAQFLAEHTPALAQPPSEELKTLAEQVRVVLSAYPADDPAVTLLKQSEAYRKVAYLIEGIAVPVAGNALQ